MDLQDVRQLNTQKLSVHCAEQTSLFRKTGDSDGRYCYELLRRAAVGDEEAWEKVYAYYSPEIQNQIKRQGVDAPDIEDLTHEVWERLRRNMLNLDKWSRFPDLKHVLAFFGDCVTSVTVDYFRTSRRRQKLMERLSLENPNWTSEEGLTQLERRELVLHCVRRHYRHENDAFLVEQLWGFGRKPQEVARRYPDKFPTAAQVSQQKRNLIDRIARDPACAQVFKDTLK